MGSHVFARRQSDRHNSTLREEICPTFEQLRSERIDTDELTAQWAEALRDDVLAQSERTLLGLPQRICYDAVDGASAANI